MTTDDVLKGWREHVQTAYLELRAKNHTIPSEVLEEMRDILLSHRANVHDSGGGYKKDADRYHWLRDNSIKQFDHPIVVTQHKRETGMLYIGPLTGPSLDEQIDAAILAEKGNDNA